MTPSQAAQEKFTSPRTEAGRTLVQRMLSSKTDDRMGPDDLQRAILAIEREAAAATPSLRAVVEEVEAEEKRWLEWWARGAKGAFVWKRDAVRAAREALDGN